MELADKYNLFVVEDAAQAIDSYYKNFSPLGSNEDGKLPLGSIGHLGTFSFHETKNIQCGEGGLLAINDERFIKRAEILWEKGTNRAEFFRGEVNKYGWVDTGSSFLPAEIVSAFLWAQLENIEDIQKKRIAIWNRYYELLKPLEEKGHIKLPIVKDYATQNGHMFYIICNSLDDRTNLINKLKQKGILSVFHYLPLHKSPYYADKYDGKDLPNANYFETHLLRLPFYYELTEKDQSYIINEIFNFYNQTL
jgi:dTDP-4-amino-4,6-dideoxygalactose transaminase